jgi:hypothetical protein
MGRGEDKKVKAGQRVIEQYYSLAYGILAKLMVDKINGKLIYK